jgi:(E)-4-hydroxy-3-methylbut-2-enyl-diphosphate synthase
MASADTAVQRLPYCEDLFAYRRRKTRVVMVGDVAVGGDNPLRLQSMTTTRTQDVDATVAQAVRLVDAGCEIVRITAPTEVDARYLKPIKAALLAKGIKVPLVADIHFRPEAALEAAEHVEKVRVNPGNFADSKAFKVKEYSDAQYAEELERIEERFTPLVLKLKRLGRALRVGTNHGSLSDRIMNRFGDSPEGMVESALEFVRICERNGYRDIILSMKASNPKVMIAAYRLLAARMAAEKMDYPFHLGVTEAGDGEDGRIKSAVGIGSLLEDGIGDTIRVSLTEEPELELPVARRIAKRYEGRAGARGSGLGTGETFSASRPQVPNPQSLAPSSHTPAPSPQSPAPVFDYYHYARRRTREVAVGPLRLGGEHAVLAVNDVSGLGLSPEKLLALLEAQLKSSKLIPPEILEWRIASAADAEALARFRAALRPETGRVAFVARLEGTPSLFDGLRDAADGFCLVPGAAATNGSSDAWRRDLRRLAEACRAAGKALVLEAPDADRLLAWARECAPLPPDLVLSLSHPDASRLLRQWRRLAADPSVKDGGFPFLLRAPAADNAEDHLIGASVLLGSLLCDGLGDAVQVGLGKDLRRDLELASNVLQGAGVRITKTEFVSCPSCGRTLFDLQSTTERIKSQTGHLKNVKIAIMGCIVNGPGEMADADFGYVGGGPGKINLYVGKECVEKGIATEEADRRLVELIKIHGKWTEPPTHE